MSAFPRGKLNPTDEGQLSMAVGIENDCVSIRFPKKVAWIAMEPDLAEKFAQSIIDKAKLIRSLAN